MVCVKCKKEFYSAKEFSKHIKKCTKLKSREYYDLYLKLPDEGICAHPNCTNPTKFKSIVQGYKKHCSCKCSNSNPEVIKKQEKTCELHYGCKRPAQNKIVMNKMQATCIDKYGAANGHGEEQKEKIRQESLKKFGVDNPWQAEEVKAKCCKTKLERYNDEKFTNREKCKETMQEKYGVVNCSQLEDWQEKVEQTKIARYNDTHYNNAAKMIETKSIDAMNFEKEHNCTLMQTIFEKFGRYWYGSKDIQVIVYKGKAYVANEDIDKIREYKINTKYSIRSIYENRLADFIQSFYNEQMLINCRSIISPKEIDIYLPDLKLGIEFNGIYWHSIEFGKTTDYHLNKSLNCREKGIRLIHIYEFEDFEEQLVLLKDLILGKDNYPKEDFNKNNLIISIPKPEIIYKTKQFTIYGAGKLVN